MLQVPSPIHHRNTWVAVFVLSLLLTAVAAWQRVPAPQIEALAPTPIAPAAPPSATGFHRLASEIGLQETLDRLGFTVNVPQSYHGHPLWRWNDYRVSDRSDAIDSGWFRSDGCVGVQELSVQSLLGADTTFGMVLDNGIRLDLLPASHHRGSWYSRDGGSRATTTAYGSFEFYIDHPVQGWGPESNKTLFSAAQDNPDRGAQLLLLPARTGGHWVSEDGNTGHWEGGVDSGQYILAWEDLVHGDHDYQDMVYLVGGIQPVDGSAS